MNISAISYYFGDKAGLYAATFGEPMGGNAGDFISLYAAPELPLEEALQIFFTRMIEPLKQGEIVRQCIQLHLREMLEPTSQWAEEMERDIKGPHNAIARILCRRLGLARPDDDVHRLSFAITGLAMQLFVSQDLVEAIRPSLLNNAAQRGHLGAAPHGLCRCTGRGRSPAPPNRRQARGRARPFREKEDMRRLRSIAALGLTLGLGLGLAGCGLTRPPAAVEAPFPAQWHAPLPHGGSLASLADWWRQLDDPLLVELIAAAEAASPNLASAAARVAEARSTRVQAGAALLPNLDATASASRGVSGSSFGSGARLPRPAAARLPSRR